jgi:hypothetical protein
MQEAPSAAHLQRRRNVALDAVSVACDGKTWTEGMACSGQDCWETGGRIHHCCLVADLLDLGSKHEALKFEHCLFIPLPCMEKAN